MYGSEYHDRAYNFGEVDPVGRGNFGMRISRHDCFSSIDSSFCCSSIPHAPISLKCFNFPSIVMQIQIDFPPNRDGYPDLGE